LGCEGTNRDSRRPSSIDQVSGLLELVAFFSGIRDGDIKSGFHFLLLLLTDTATTELVFPDLLFFFYHYYQIRI